jgi:hypothetical protein
LTRSAAGSGLNEQRVRLDPDSPDGSVCILLGAPDLERFGLARNQGL